MKVTNGLVLGLVFFVCFSMQNMLIGQDYRLVGQVVDLSTDEPLPGAVIETQSKGTATDMDGKFVLNLSDPKGKAVARFVGYEVFEFSYDLTGGGKAPMIIKLREVDLILGTMTVTAGRYERKLSEAVVSLEVIRPQLIENTNTIAVDQVLQKMPGVDIVGGQPNIRGGSGFSYGAGSRVLMLLDDIPALQADAGFPNWNDFPVENIAQIEILKGASSVLYGSSALNGIINVLTGYPVSEPVTKAAVFYTHYMDPADPAKRWWNRAPYEMGASFLHKEKFQKLDLVMSGFFRNNQSFNESTFDKYARVTANLRYRFSDKLLLGINSNFNPGENADFFYWLDGEDGAFRAAPDVVNESKRFRFNIDPYLTYFDKTGSRHKILSRYFYIDNNNSDNRSNQSSLGYVEYQFLKNFESLRTVLTAGAVLQGTAVKAELYGDTTYTSRNTAAYIQTDHTIVPGWTVSEGLRFEHNVMFSPEMVGDFNIPNGRIRESRPVLRIGTNVKVASYTHFRASYGEGYRFPTVAERFINTPLGPVSIFPNPTLESETGWTAEVGFKQGLKLGKWSGFFDAATFIQEYDNMMEFVATIDEQFNFGFQSQNIGDTRISGFDANINGAGKIGRFETTLLTGYTYINPRYRNFTEQDSLSSSAKRNILKYRFQHTFKLDIESGTDRFRLGFSILRYSNMDNIDAILEEIVVPGLKDWRAANNSGFTVVDIRTSYSFNKIKLSLLLKNALNKEFSLRPGLLEAPRNITLRMDYAIQGG